MSSGPFVAGVLRYDQFYPDLRTALRKAIDVHKAETRAAIVALQLDCIGQNSRPRLSTGLCDVLDAPTALWVFERMLDRDEGQAEALAAFDAEYASVPRLTQFTYCAWASVLSACTDSNFRWLAPAEVRQAMIQHLCVSTPVVTYADRQFVLDVFDADIMLCDMVRLGINQGRAEELYKESCVSAYEVLLKFEQPVDSLIAAEPPLGSQEDVLPQDSISQQLSQVSQEVVLSPASISPQVSQEQEQHAATDSMRVYPDQELGASRFDALAVNLNYFRQDAAVQPGSSRLHALTSHFQQNKVLHQDNVTLHVVKEVELLDVAWAKSEFLKDRDEVEWRDSSLYHKYLMLLSKSSHEAVAIHKVKRQTT